MAAILARRYDTGEAVAVETRDGRVVAICERSGDSTDALPWISPGFVDLQVNGYGGDEFSSPAISVDAVQRVTQRMLSFGVTRFCPTVTTASREVLRHAMQTIAGACESIDLVRHCVLGIHLEGPYISPVDGARGAHPLEHCRAPDWNEFCELQDAAGGRIRLLTMSPEYDGAVAFIRQVVASGVLVSIGHTVANRAQILAAVEAGARMSTHLGNGAQREMPRHPNYLWDQLAEDRLAAGLIVDGHHLPPEVVQSFVRAKSPERCVLVSDLSGFAGLPPGVYSTGLCEVEILSEGRLVIAGQQQLLAGASRPIGDGIANVMDFAHVTLSTAVAMATLQALQLLGVPPGTFAVDAAADFVLFSLIRDNDAGRRRLKVQSTWLNGECVYSHSHP